MLDFKNRVNSSINYSNTFEQNQPSERLGRGKKIGEAVKGIFKRSKEVCAIRAKRFEPKENTKVEKEEEKILSESSDDEKIMGDSFVSVKIAQFTDQEIKKLINDVAQTPKTSEDGGKRLDDCEQIRKILFEDSGHDPVQVLNMIFDHDYGLVVVGILLELDDASYSVRKEKVLTLMKKMYDESDSFLKQYSDQIHYKLERFSGYLRESQTGQFVRKNTLRGPSSSARTELLMKPLFLKSEIVSISKISSSGRLKTESRAFIPRTVSENSKGIVQQCAIKTCGQTCVAMLLLDHEMTPDFKTISAGSWSNNKSMIKLLADGGLKAESDMLSTKSKNEFILRLKSQVDRKGSTIVGIKGLKEGRIGGHLLICDYVSFDLLSVRIRDPWHGWEMTVTADAFLDCVSDEKGKNFSAEMLWIVGTKSKK